MEDGRDPRWWQFWRRAFWTRPAFLLVPALVGALAIPALAYDEYLSLRADARLDRGCCLEEVTGVLDDDYDRRDFGQDFTVVVDDGTEHGRHLDIDVTFRASLRLDDFEGREVTAYLADDVVGQARVVAVRTPDGELVRAWGSGGRGVLLTLSYVGFGLAFGAGMLGFAVRKAAALRQAGHARTAWGTWWAVGDVRFDPVQLVPAALILNSSAILIGLAFGVPWWLLFGMPLLAAVALLVRARRSGGGRHARQSRPGPPA
jgi:hypothetical protein